LVAFVIGEPMASPPGPEILYEMKGSGVRYEGA
jgi:hypothetical protein